MTNKVAALFDIIEDAAVAMEHMTEEEVDAVLNEAGIDPAKAAETVRAIFKKALEKHRADLASKEALNDTFL